MLQKTYHIKDYTPDKLEAVMAEVEALRSYEASAQILLLIFEQNWDTDIIREKAEAIKARLKKVEIAGCTHFDGIFEEGTAFSNNSVLTFLFFEQPSFTIHQISLADADPDTEIETETETYQTAASCEERVGEALCKIVSNTPDITCVMTLFTAQLSDTGTILGIALKDSHDVPAFGATAGKASFFMDEESGSYVISSDGAIEKGLLVIVFHGRDLHVRASGNFGWRQVGRTMTVTKVRDPYHITEIDGRPAADIYEKYLGIPYRINNLSSINISEFPLSITEQTDDGRTVRLGRIPYSWNAEGELSIAIAVHEGDKIRFTYGLPQQIFEQIYEDTEELREFAPQAVLMVICMNRMIFLREAEHFETDAYRCVVPEAAFLHGNSEILRYHGAGGEMHSALVAVGFREGDAEAMPKPECDGDIPAGDQLIPLELRLMTFMSAVTGDLEETTEELTELKDHLEDEVERKTRENESMELHVVQTLAEAIDAKDTYTNGHSGRVAAYSREIARRYGYSEKDQNEIYMMGLLHDVGKIGVPDAVINKPGRLTDEEFEEIRNHPVMGARILKTIKEMPRLVTGARWHHERYDGRGYPDGLKGADIPEEARIIAVADAYDAMTSNRSYRRGMDQSRVREQIESGRGSQFDPAFAEIMLAMIDEDKGFKMREM